MFPFRHDFFYKLLTNFNIMQIIFLSEIIFLALVQINGKVLIDFRNLFTEISAARMNYKKICSVRRFVNFNKVITAAECKVLSFSLPTQHPTAIAKTFTISASLRSHIFKFFY